MAAAVGDPVCPAALAIVLDLGPDAQYERLNAALVITPRYSEVAPLTPLRTPRVGTQL